jgi:hypothetical protein
LRVNNGEALLPALLAGLGIADLPDFIVGDAIAAGEVEVILKGWKQTEGAVHLVTPPGGPRPARVEVLADFLIRHFAKKTKKRTEWFPPPLEGEGRRECNERRGGVTVSPFERCLERSPRPGSHFAALNVSRPSPSRGG